MDPIRLSTASLVEAALLDRTLVPPQPPPDLHDGATRDLRGCMARFSPPATHADRRADVVGAIGGLDAFRFAGEADVRTTAILGDAARLDGGVAFDGYARLGLVVPVEVVASALGVPDSALGDVLRDVGAVVEVIGRRHRSSPAADRSTSQLLERFGGDSRASVAAVSLLYQTHDATAALFASHLVARHRHGARRPALATTTRVATTETAVGSTSVPSGATVTIDLESSGFEFGAGPHACPGRGIAERIVAGMLDAIDASGLHLRIDEIEWQPDGRPATLPMRP